MTRSAATLTIALVVISASGLAQAPTDPWKRVPALPTGCYANEGGTDKWHDLRISIEDDLRKQTELNAELKQKFENMDMMEKMNLMRAYMAKDPQGAQKMMAAQQQTATTMKSDVTGADEDNEKLMAQRDELKGAFDKATKAATGPIDAKIKAYVDAKTVLVGEIGRGFETQAAFDGYAALVAERNAAYEKACAPFFGAGGSFHTWVKDYRTKVADRNAAVADAADGIVAQQMVIMKTPAGPGFQPLGAFMSARDYLREAEKVFGFREAKAKPGVPMVRK